MQHVAHNAEQTGFGGLAEDGVLLSVRGDSLNGMTLGVGDGTDDLNRSGCGFTCYCSLPAENAETQA